MTRTLLYVLLVAATAALRQKGPSASTGRHPSERPSPPAAAARAPSASSSSKNWLMSSRARRARSRTRRTTTTRFKTGRRLAHARASLEGPAGERWEDAHPRSRFLSELSARNDNSTARLLQPQRAATLLGTARMAFRRRSLAPICADCRGAPRACDCGVRTRPRRSTRPAVALADAPNALRRRDEAHYDVRKLAIERSSGKQRGPSRERLVRAFERRRADFDEPTVIIFRDNGGCVFRREARAARASTTCEMKRPRRSWSSWPMMRTPSRT